MAAIASDGTRYEVVGADGPAVVLVHGLGLNRHMWRWQTEALAARHRLVLYDLFGHGESPAPPEQPSLSLFSGQLRGLLDDLGLDKVAVAGFSLGGMIARRFAMDHGDRLWALAILHSPYKREPAAHEAIQRRVEQARRDGPQATVDAALERWLTQDFRNGHPEVAALIRDWVLANDRTVYPTIYQVLVDGVEELIVPDPAIACPTLVMTGDEDYGNSPAMTRAIAAEIPGATAVVLPGLRHLAMIEAPERFNGELLSFLEGACCRVGETAGG